jgi:hypothetical protein
MNKLMTFNPEPFDSEFEFDEMTSGLGARSEIGEQEDETEIRRGRMLSGRGRVAPSFRLQAPRQGGTRSAKTATRQPKPAAWPKGRSRRRWGYYPPGASGWPYAVDPGEWPSPDAPRSDFVAWVQTALNGFLGLRLPVNGVMNAPTRSAVRSFQERRGLPITGLLGPETQAALRNVGRGAEAPPSAAPEPPPSEPPSADASGSADASSPPDAAPAEKAEEFEQELDLIHTPAIRQRAWAPGSTSAPAAPTVKVLRDNIVRIAKRELPRWANGTIKERDPRVRNVLRGYWKHGPGLDFSDAQLGSAAFQNSHPWSAAFISWVMRKAGAGKAFKYASSHSVYTSAAKANRLAGNANPFKAYRLAEVAPRVGDLICRARAGSGATYDNIHPGMKTHCDIVVEVRPKALTVIGGNVANSVTSRIVHTDDLGRVIEPNAFAVIRVGLHKPRVPDAPSAGLTPPAPGPAPAPRPAPTIGPSPTPPPSPAPKPSPSAGQAPKLLKQETSPPAATLYAEIDLGIVDRFKQRAAPMTGIFLPDGYTPGASVDILLYLHGHKASDLTIDRYWDAKRYPYGPFREELNAAKRKLILVAPTLGARSEAKKLLDPGGLDATIAKVLAAIGAYAPGARGGPPPSLRNLILACHSGGGAPMRSLANGTDRALASLRECWGFDCTYNRRDDTIWADWARKTPNAKCYFYYIKGSGTAALSERLRDQRVANAIVVPSRDARHYYVPITYWRERIEGAAFLDTLAASGVSPSAPSSPSPSSPSPAPAAAPASEPDNLKGMSHADFIAFVGRHARAAAAATGVPASVTVAQAILESGWGKHTIGAAKNLFGIKGKGPAGSVRAPTREFLRGAWVTIDADFAKYDTFAQSIVEHARFFLRNKRYAAALAAKSDPDSFAREIQKAGYATAPTYASELIKLMKAHDLYRFDY